MARTVKSAAVGAYLRQAEEFLETAHACFEARRYNAAGFNSIQALINANDALTARFLGAVGSLDHREAVKLHSDVVRVLGDASHKDLLKRNLDSRSAFGYLGVSASRAETERAIRDAARFVQWVRTSIGRPG